MGFQSEAAEARYMRWFLEHQAEFTPVPAGPEPSPEGGEPETRWGMDIHEEAWWVYRAREIADRAQELRERENPRNH